MANLTTLSEERLDTLAKGEHIRPSTLARERRYNLLDYKHIKRFLHSRLGTAWDQVVSNFVHEFELPASIKPLTALRDIVETNTFLDEKGLVCAYKQYSFLNDPVLHISEDKSYREIFYVHPSTQTLCVQEHKKQPSWKKLKSLDEQKWLLRLGPWHQYQKVHGVWYELQLLGMEALTLGKWSLQKYSANAPINTENPIPTEWQEILTKDSGDTVKKPILIKRQLNSKEIKKHHLK